MNKKIFLILIMLGMITFGLSYVFSLFSYSLAPNKKADAELPRVEVGSIENGTYKFVKNPAYGTLYDGYEWYIFFYRSQRGELYAWDLPIKNGAVGMPDLQWWRPMYECKNFGPSFTNGRVNEDLPIQCHDQIPHSEFWLSEWRWNIQGKNLGKSVSDLVKTKGAREGKYFVLLKNS